MSTEKKPQEAEKTNLHPRNKHRKRYDFKVLKENCPDIKKFIKITKHGDESIDFFNSDAVRMLNKALLKYFYGIDNWDIPKNYLIPPIPGRADYIHHIADLLASSNNGKIPKGSKINCLDIGVGANCIYPIIGNTEYGWSFVGSDIDIVSIESANKIVNSSKALTGNIELRLQSSNKSYFNTIIHKDEFIDISICNPPFHSSLEDMQSGNIRKLNKLKHKRNRKVHLNFGGQSNELWCVGGEAAFVGDMIIESKQFAKSCLWFTTLVSKESNLKGIYASLKYVKAMEVKTIAMAQGNKSSRIVAWTFLDENQRKKWAKIKWKE